MPVATRDGTLGTPVALGRARNLDRGIPDDRKLAALTRVVNAARNP